MRPQTVALLGFLVLAGPACQSQTAPAPQARVEADPAARAAAALDAGRYAEAAALYREALSGAPDSVGLRYGLAVALSYTDRGAAIREFQWVLANAQPGSQESVESRAWLVRAGALLVGRAMFAEGSAKPQPMGRLQLFLRGDPESPTKEERFVLRTDEEGNFKFPNVPPGPYMLTNRIAGQPIWRLRVELKPAEEQQLELNPGNSVAVRDDFPQPR